MIKNYLSISFLAFICAFSINEISAQDKTVSKKVVVIEKSVDQDGKVTQKKIVKEGAEADKYIKEMEDEEKNVFVLKSEDEKISKNVVKKQAYKIKTVDEEGNEDVIEWNGDGEMPNEIKEMMEKEGVNEDIEKTIIKKQAYKIKTVDGEGNEDVIEWNGEGEMPQEIKEMMEKEGMNKDGHEPKRIRIKKSIDGDNQDIEIDIEGGDLSDEMIQMLKEEDIDIEIGSDSNKAQLGVFIENDDAGVKVTELIPGSAAEESGILEGDIITKVDDKKVMSLEMLMEVMADYSPGDKTRVGIIRNGEKTYKDLVLKEAKNVFKMRAHGDKDHMIKVFEVEEDVIIEKKK
ncbi:MAG: PDZ domain-containing protein [Saprospiraceae bacterium]|nr:PDZ domain-containing protein [Saprospiraceae bacterium]